MPTHSHLLALTLPLLLALPATADDLSWSTLTDLRRELHASSPLTVDFTQSLVPTGFAPEDAESESGTLAIGLPECLRWDYLGDFAKSFLLCDEQAWYWNPGEPEGQLYDIDERADAPGLDFFLRTAEELQDRYVASGRVEGNEVIIDLEPTQPSEDVVALELRIDREGSRLRSLSYEDAEGSVTTFELGDYRPGVSPGSFAVPEGVEWVRQ